MRKFICLLLVLFCLTACHGQAKTTGFTVPEDYDSSKTYEITFWAKNDSNKNQVAIYKKAISDFEAIYPNIKVNLSLYTDYGQIYNDVITNISTNTTPNVCITYPDHIATYLTGNNVVVPLDELMDDAKYGFGGSEIKFDGPSKDEIVSKFLNEGVIDGHQYALPFMRSTEALYINKDFVEKLGYEIPDVVTWDYIFEVSEKAMAKDEDGNFLVNGQKTMIPFIYKSTDNMMIQLLRQSGAGYSDDNGNIEIFNDTTKELLLEIAKHAESRAFSTFKISSYPANFLNAGQCIFAVDSTAGATWMGSDAPLVDIPEEKLVRFETVVREVPQEDADNPTMISQGPSICIFNKSDVDEVLASWIFAQYLLSNDIQISYSETEGYIPVTTKAIDDPSYQDYLSRGGEDNLEHYSIKIDVVKLLIDNIDNTFTTSVFNGSASLRNAAGQLIEETVKGARRGKDVDGDFIDQLFEDVRSLYRLDQIGNLSTDLGPLPTGSKVLLITLTVVWLGIGAYCLKEKNKDR
ncbi:MAG: extracellular solute-binding protein [Solobacterium sp.]|nr:extracellular solute-binding protein [Solobacterium sp.]MCI6878770.1 extracellular solute-binding protein [Solobacterium sp.]MCI7445458.1 extracellular solute-binding protein [Solobacterium sp.]